MDVAKLNVGDVMGLKSQVLLDTLLIMGIV